MAKLLVKLGNARKNEPFHPTLKICVASGYCRNQWQELHFRPGMFTGADCVARCSVEMAIKGYMSELKRMGYEEVTQPGGTR